MLADVAAAVAVGAALAVAACGAGSGPSQPTNLTVFAAASLRDAIADVAAAYAVSEPDVRLALSADSSAALRTQIEFGAPADVFLAADTASPRRLVAAGLADGPAVAFATNALAIAVPRGNPAGLWSPADLARPGLRIVAAGQAVPISHYAALAIEQLGRLPGYPAAFAAAYDANVVSREDNVAAVVAKLALGEGDAGIVYRTDVIAATDGLEMIAIPEPADVEAVYEGIVVAASTERPAARAFLEWLAGPAGRAILAGRGFGPPAR